MLRVKGARSLLWYVVALAATIAIPLILLATALAVRWVESEHLRLQAGTFEVADDAMQQVDRYIIGRIAMLQALATSPAFDARDYRRIDEQARELLDLQGSTIVLRELDGRQLINTRLPLGTKLPRGTIVAADVAVVDTKLPYVSDLYMGTASGGPLVRIIVPVVREGSVILTLTASLPPKALQNLIVAAGVTAPYSAKIVDRNGFVLASTGDGLPGVGELLIGFPDFGGERGYRSTESPAGEKIETAYRRSTTSGWLILVSAERAIVDAALYRSLYLFGLVAATLCLVAMVLSWRLGRTLVSSQRKVAQTANSFRLGEVLVPPRTSVLEADLVGEALVEASVRLRTKAAIIAAANEELEERVVERTRQISEQSELIGITLENMDQGLILIGPDQKLSLINHRAVELLELPADIVASKPALEAIAHLLPPELSAAGTYQDDPNQRVCERPNGMILEVRTSSLPSGGEVRTYTDVSAALKAERAVRDSEERLRLIADNATDMIVRSDLDSTRRYVSPGCRALLGYEPQELIGTKPLDGAHPDEAEAYGQVLAELRRGRRDEAISQQRYRRRDGSWVWTEATFKLTRDSAGVPNGYVAAVRDISSRKASEEALRQSEERLAYALDSGSDGLWDRDIPLDQTWYSDRWHAMLGYEPSEINGPRSKLVSLIHPDDRPSTAERMAAHLAGRAPVYECEHRLRTKSGRYSWVLARGKVVRRDAEGAPIRIVGTQIDIDARKNAESRIAYMARHDALTDLPNRTVFYECLDQRLKEVRRHDQSCAVLCLDLDRFKAVNDALGHSAGDALLFEIARRIRSMVRIEDTVARLGGDEFAILLHSARLPEAVAKLAERLIDVVGQPFLFEQHEVQVGLSIGVAFAPRHGDDSQTVFKRADLALYRAKAGGRDTFRFFEPAMDEAVEERRRLELDMRRAIQLGEFELHYQPLLCVETGQISGMEALVRWRHPTLGMIPPGSFIPLAEETGLIVPLGEWVLRTAISDACLWPGELRVAVNISAVQFRHASLMQAVVSSLATSGLPASRLELEITESVLIENSETAFEYLRAFRQMGIRIALDDFGTGYSSLSYLRQFEFDKIKIDRSFVAAIFEVETAAIVRAIVGLGISLGMTVTAEGVETAAQFDLLCNEGCTEIQGYLISRPMRYQDLACFGEQSGSRSVICSVDTAAG